MLKRLPRFGRRVKHQAPLTCLPVSFLRNKGNAGGDEERKVRELRSRLSSLTSFYQGRINA
jgi:hypothetical protein